MQIGAVNFAQRRQGAMTVEPWIVPFVKLESTDLYPDPFMRQDAQFDRDMIVLQPGQSYTGFVQAPDDSVVRVLDAAIICYSKESGRYWQTDSRPFEASPLLNPVSGLDYANELDFTLSNAGPGTVIGDDGTPAEMLQFLQPRPGGVDSIINHLLPPRGILRFTLTHTGQSTDLRIAGVFRGTRNRF